MQAGPIADPATLRRRTDGGACRSHSGIRMDSSIRTASTLQANLLPSVVRLRGLLVGLALVSLAACNSTDMAQPSADDATSVSALAATGGGDGELAMVKDLPPPPNILEGGAQPVAIGDVIEVSVFQVPDLSRVVQVDDGGFINLPLIGQIAAANKSPNALQRDIERAYGAKYLQSPSVSVLVKESAATRVTVDGEVRRAGVYPLPPSATLVDAVSLASGLTELADLSKIYVFRQIGDRKYVAQYDIGAIRQGKSRNPRIYGGDVVIVFQSKSRVALQNLKEALGMASSASRIAVIP